MVEAIQEVGGIITLNAPVSSIALTNPGYEKSTMTVTAAGQQHIYSHVISTIPMPNLRTIDLSTPLDLRRLLSLVIAGHTMPNDLAP